MGEGSDVRKRILLTLTAAAASMLAIGVLCVLAGCASSSSQTIADSVEGLDDLGSISVVAREEGSGTRDAFAQLLDFKGSNASQDTSDLTTDDALIEGNAEAVVEAVAADEGAIGYVSSGTLDASDAGVKTLLVDGIAPGEEGYPLSRMFYLAYNGDLSDLERDFITYVLGAGQDIVSEGYVPVASSSTFLSNNEAGTITVAGSTSVAPLLEELAKRYEEINPNAAIVIEESDSTDGLTRAIQSTCDIGMSSRDLKDYEAELLECVAIAQDDISVIVNAENPLSSVSSAQLKSIYTGEIADWGSLTSSS